MRGPGERELSEKQRLDIIFLRGQGLSYERIAKKVGCSKTAVLMTFARYQKKGTIHDLHRSGRPRKLDRHNALNLKKSLRAGAFDNASEARAELGLDVSIPTVHRVLHSIGTRAYKKQAKQLLTPTHKKNRVKWCTDMLDKDADYFSTWWFADECAVFSCDGKGKRWVWDFPSKGLSTRRMKPVAQGKGIKQMVWMLLSSEGIVAHSFMSDHVTGEEYKDVLKNALAPQIRKFWPQGGDDVFVYAQDNAPVHSARVASDYLHDLSGRLDFTVADWPAKSPDLNPIENFFAHFKAQLRRERAPTSKMALQEQITSTLCKINANEKMKRDEGKECLFTKLYASMPDRVQKIVAARGNPT
eukprot:m.239750 g.239750  ORF g.239750 m.239750 type:complete len:357 (+) comp22520_c3_seq28:2272-3342(+)